MNVLFCGGDNWYPAIIGSKAVWLYILKAFRCVFVPFTLEIVLPYLLELGCYFGEVISI